MHSRLKGFRLLIFLPVAILAIGTLGFMLFEKLSFIDAFYFTIVTISTVGYANNNSPDHLKEQFSLSLRVLTINQS